MCKSNYNTTPEAGYKALGYAIVAQAAEDYLKVRQDIDGAENFESYSNPEIIGNLRRKKARLVNFFMSDWYQLIGTIDGKTLLHKLDEEFEERKANGFKE